jgi:uncharacterized protein (TIGR03435 family)
MPSVRVVIALIVLWLAPEHAAQTQPQSPTGATPVFDVASVKPNRTGTVVLPDGQVARGGTSIGAYDGRFTAQNASLRTLVTQAYGLPEFRVSTASRWIIAERFDVDARAGTAVDDRDLMLMLQALLAERFQLAVHREMKEMPAYVLVVSRSGSRLRQSAGTAAADGAPRQRLRYRISEPNEDKIVQIDLGGTGTISDLGALLAATLRTPFLDETGLSGFFDISLKWNSTFVPTMKAADGEGSLGEPPSVHRG